MSGTNTRFCLVVPHYDHVDAFERFLPELVLAGHDIFVVEDGSDATTRKRCESACQRASDAGASVHLLCHEHNRGKGAAFFTGATAAAEQGFTHVIQIDADGQHAVEDLPAFVALAENHPNAIVSGLPVFGADAPAARVHGRKLTTAMIAVETIGGGIKDGLCGFRVYPVSVLQRLQQHFSIAPRMGFDTDALVKARWLDVPVLFLPTVVLYPDDGKSHFHYLRDNSRLVVLHVRLLAGALWRLPILLPRRLRARSVSN